MGFDAISAALPALGDIFGTTAADLAGSAAAADLAGSAAVPFLEGSSLFGAGTAADLSTTAGLSALAPFTAGAAVTAPISDLAGSELASGFAPAGGFPGLSLPGGFGGTPGGFGGTPIPGSAAPAAPGASPIQNLGGTFQATGAAPGAPGASGATGASAFSAPAGVGGVADATSTVAPAAPGAASAAPAGSSLGDLLKSAGGYAKDIGTVAGPLVGGATLGYDILQAKQNGVPSTSSVANQLQSQATTTGNTGAALQQYLLNGTLPAGLQASLDQNTQSAIAAAKSAAAAAGMPTDPTKNSSLAQEIQQIQANETQQVAQLGQQLLASGGADLSLASADLGSLANIDQQQSTAIQTALANFVRSLAGGTSIKTGGSTVTVN